MISRGDEMIIKKKKILFLILILTIFYCLVSSLPVYSLDFEDANKFREKGSHTASLTELNTIGESFSQIGKILVYIGAGVLVGGVSYIGIVYMVSSPEKQAKLKEQLIGLAVAGIIIFGGFFILFVLHNS